MAQSALTVQTVEYADDYTRYVWRMFVQMYIFTEGRIRGVGTQLEVSNIIRIFIDISLVDNKVGKVIWNYFWVDVWSNAHLVNGGAQWKFKSARKVREASAHEREREREEDAKFRSKVGVMELALENFEQSSSALRFYLPLRSQPSRHTFVRTLYGQRTRNTGEPG